MTHLFRIFLVASLLGLCSCSMAVEIKISNMSYEKITQVEVRAGHVMAVTSQVDVGFEKRVKLTPTGDSGLELTFHTESGVVKACTVDVYLTKGLRGRIDVAIKEDFSCELREVNTKIR